MSVTSEMVARLRRMVDEAGDDTYDDDAIEAAIARYPTLDGLGEPPTVRDITTSPPSLTTNPDWTPTYDLHAAASDLWSEKAAAVGADYDFASEGARYQRSQVYEQYLRASRHHAARRSMNTIALLPWPEADA